MQHTKMKARLACLSLLAMVLVYSGCQYRKGESFTWSGTADSVKYLILSSGSGKRIQEKLARLVWMHESKGDKCRVIFVSDSAGIYDSKSILLFNSVMPDVSKDMLTKGFIGTFSTRQNVTYLVVVRNDFEKNFKPSPK